MKYNPDSKAFHADFYIYEKNGTLANRRVTISVGEKLISRIKTKTGYESISTITAGISPTFRTGDDGYFNIDILQSESIKVRIWSYDPFIIKTRIVKKQKIIVYLDEISKNDCYEYYP